MAKKTKSELKNYFQAGKRPTESQFEDFIDSYAHLDDSTIKNLHLSEYYTELEFPANYQVGDYVEFLEFEPSIVNAAGHYEVSLAYTRVNLASAATHIAAVSHANPDIWRECGRINANNIIDNETQYGVAFTVDVNGSSCRFRIRAVNILGITTYPVTVKIKIRSINKNEKWVELDNRGNEASPLFLQPMTNEWNLLVGRLHTNESAKIGLKVNTQGNVGVGTSNPLQKLSIVGNQGLNEGAPTNGQNSSALLRVQSNGTGNGEVMDFGMNVQPSYGWIQPQDLNNSNAFYNLSLNPKGGNVGIGTQNPDQKLTVKGKIHAEDVIVDMNVPADYVFQKYYDNYSSIREDYSMMNLNDLEAFIKENKHLPEIPSGEKMTQDGVTLGDFQMKLLQKIEELTLYAISQNKEIEQLKSQINKQ